MKVKNLLLLAALGMARLSAQVVLNPDFEGNNINEWTVVITGAAGGVASNTLGNGFNTGTVTYPDGDVATDLGDFIAFANTTTSRTMVSYTTDVFDNDGTTPQLIQEGDDLTLTLAIGNRQAASGNFSRGSDATISVGYLATPGDDSTFVALQSDTYTQFDLYGPTSPSFVPDNSFADFAVTTEVLAGSSAIGNQFAVQIVFDQAGQTQSRQSVFDNVRVSTGASISSLVASPNSLLGTEDVALSWSTIGAGRIKITDDQGSLPIIYTATADGQAFLDSGMVTIPNVSTETVYTLSAAAAEDGSGTPVTQMVTATIQSAPDVTLVAAPSVSNGASDVTLFFNTTVIELQGAEAIAGEIEGFGESGDLAANQVQDTDVTDFATILTGGPYLFEVTDGNIAGTQYDITGFSGDVLTVDGTPATDGLVWTDYRIVEPSTFRGSDNLNISDGSTTVFSSTDPSVIAGGSITIPNVSADTTFTATATFPGGGSTQDDATFLVTGDGSSYEETILAQNPIGFYRFEESLNSPTIYDSSGNEAHSVAINNAEFLTSGSAGIIGNGGAFDEPGTVGAAVVTGVSLDPSASSWSITALIRPDELFNEDAHLVSNRDGGGTGRSMLFIDDGTSIVQSFSGATNTPDINDAATVASTPAYISNASCHVALTYDLASTTLSVYVDGTLTGQKTSITPESAAGAWVIGAHKNNAGNLFWDGIVDEMAFFDSALAPSEIAAQNTAFLNETTLGILAFGRDTTITLGESTELFVKVGASASSATIDNGVGPVSIGTSSLIPVSPNETTTYTLDVDGDQQAVTITVEAPSTITITNTGFDGSGNFFIDVAEGVAGFKVTTSPDLVAPFTDATGVSDDGANRFTIASGSLDSNADGSDFFRVETE